MYLMEGYQKAKPAERTLATAPHGAAMRRTIGSSETLYFEGDPRTTLYVVERGWLKLYRTLVDGQRHIVGFANRSSILGMVGDESYANSCEAITPVTLRAYPIGAISALCRSDPAFANQMIAQIGRQLGLAQTQLATLGTLTAQQQIATFLLSLADLCETGPDGEFDMPMKRGDMAEFLGMRLETVSRKMAEFQRRGWIKMPSLYRCRLARRDMLKALAQGGEALAQAG